MRPAIILAAILAFAPASAAADARGPESAARILVQGSATIERPPEWVRLTMVVRGEGANQVEALKDLAATRQRIEQGLVRMEGLERARFEADSIDIVELRAPACRTRDSQGSYEVLTQGECAIAGAVARLQLDVIFSPPSMVGNVAAYATQLGAKRVAMAGSGVLDDTRLRAEALRTAVANARREAAAIAEAADERLGPVLQVQDADASFRVTTVGSEHLELTATLTVDTLLDELPQIIPISLDLTPPNVKASARVTVSFGVAP